MSSAAAAAAAPAASPKKGRKKIIIIAAAVVVLLVVGGIAAFFALKSHPADEDEDEVEVAAVHKHKKEKHAAPEPFDPKHAPTFVPLEVFTVNLADRDNDRYAQVGITLEVEDGKAGEQIKAFMPAIRNNILMVLARKSSGDVRSDEGKKLLAAEVHAQALRPLGYDFEPEDLMEDDEAPKPGASKRKKRKLPPLPIKAVHFANFIVQ